MKSLLREMEEEDPGMVLSGTGEGVEESSEEPVVEDAGQVVAGGQEVAGGENGSGGGGGVRESLGFVRARARGGSRTLSLSRNHVLVRGHGIASPPRHFSRDSIPNLGRGLPYARGQSAGSPSRVAAVGRILRAHGLIRTRQDQVAIPRNDIRGGGGTAAQSLGRGRGLGQLSPIKLIPGIGGRASYVRRQESSKTPPRGRASYVLDRSVTTGDQDGGGVAQGGGGSPAENVLEESSENVGAAGVSPVLRDAARASPSEDGSAPDAASRSAQYSPLTTGGRLWQEFQVLEMKFEVACRSPSCYAITGKHLIQRWQNNYVYPGRVLRRMYCAHCGSQFLILSFGLNIEHRHIIPPTLY